MNYFIGYDIGSSSIKAALYNGQTGQCVSSASFPEKEMAISAPRPGFAEQNPDMWWEALKQATNKIIKTSAVNVDSIKAIGLSYQMHGLVMVGHDGQVLRPSIIWCDGRAVAIGDKAYEQLGKERCLQHLLNSPGNFTASKLKWVKENEPELYRKTYKIMLPGDYIAYKMTGQMQTTQSGLSEAMLWDFKENRPASFVLEHYDISPDLIPDIVPVFGEQGTLSLSSAQELGLKEHTIISYRAGDQPNNAFSLNALKHGEVAATGGTSGVVYAVSNDIMYDEECRINNFAHVNHSIQENRIGALLCISGCGIANSWIRKNCADDKLSYIEMNRIASDIPIGSENLLIFPFGNGPERMLGNKDLGASIHNLNFNIHSKAHMYRAVQEGVAFAFKYGMEIMEEKGLKPHVIKAGNANIFLSDIFKTTLSSISDAQIDIYETDGAIGAARGAAVGSGFCSIEDAFVNLEKISSIYPDTKNFQYKNAYQRWKQTLEDLIRGIS